MASLCHASGADSRGRGAFDQFRCRWILLVTALMLLSGMGWLVPTDAAGYETTMSVHGAAGRMPAQGWDGNVPGTVKDTLRATVSSPSGGERWIDVDRSNGQVTLYEGSNALYVFWGSLSRDSSDGFYATASGTYYVYTKHKALTYTPYADNFITHWVGFDDYRRNGFHSYTKDANGYIVPSGAGYTAGCVALGPGAIDTLYDFAYIGMRVEIHW